jgi:hypothetical protein
MVTGSTVMEFAGLTLHARVNRAYMAHGVGPVRVTNTAHWKEKGKKDNNFRPGKGHEHCALESKHSEAESPVLRCVCSTWVNKQHALLK